jgi:xylan 1,4-beta-xylosidase
MKTVLFGVCLFSVLALTAAEYRNPVMAGDYPDPSVIRVGTEYWAVATSSEWGPQFPLLLSRDLINWQQVGNVFMKRPEWSVANYWAPEIAERNGRIYVYYVARKKGGPLAVAVATADKPSGPYKDHGVLVAQDAGSIDPMPFDDENGQRCLIWKEDGNSRKQPTILWIQRLNEDGTKLIGEPREILRNDAKWEGAVVEGPFVMKRDNWFYVFYAGSGCCGAGCNYAVGVARSKSLHGPYEKYSRNPIVAGNEMWKCPGHGSIVTTPQGRHFFMYHAYAVKDSIFTGRQALLDEVTFTRDGWPVINEDKGPSTNALPPYEVHQSRSEVNFSDSFDRTDLRPGWQWPVANEPNRTVREGFLTLSPGQQTNDFVAAVLARTTTTGDYSARTIVSRVSAGTFAGIAAFGDPANAMGLAVGSGGKLVLWLRQKGKHQVLAESSVPKKGDIHLQLTAKEGHRFQFFARGDETQQWMPIGQDLQGKHLPPWDRNVRVALTVGGAEGATGRFADFALTAMPSTTTSDSAK